MPSNSTDQLHRRTLLILVLVISLLFLWMVRGFLIALLLAAVFSAMANPLSSRLKRWCGGRAGLAAVITILVLLIVVGAPLSAFMTLVATQAVDISQAARPWIEQQITAPGGIREFLDQYPALQGIIPEESEIIAKVGEFASAAGRFLANSVVGLTRGTVNFFLQLFVLLYAMYFFLKDGDYILDRILYYIPLPPDSEMELIEKIVSVTRAVLKGSLVIGIIQGTLAGAAFWVAGVPGWAFWTTVMIVLSIIPAVGSALVWIPAAVYLAFNGSTLTTLLFVAWCAAVVGTVDNFLRPRLIGKDTKMPDLLVLIGTLGGIFLFGAIGFILGPIVAGLFLAVWYMYGDAYSDVLEESEIDPDPPSL
ncbi:MAG: AI-2E family transporter [Rhodothermales bacterium]|nr:AI-2E family transporter [Rhodothermales bacterium]